MKTLEMFPLDPLEAIKTEIKLIKKNKPLHIYNNKTNSWYGLPRIQFGANHANADFFRFFAFKTNIVHRHTHTLYT